MLLKKGDGSSLEVSVGMESFRGTLHVAYDLPNQDSVAVLEVESDTPDQSDWLVVVVCDGAGGREGALEASSGVVNAIENTTFPADRNSTSAEAWLRLALKEAASALGLQAQSEPRLKGMTSTAIVMVVCIDEVIIGHLGDTLAYRYRDGGPLEPLTAMHRLVSDPVIDEPRRADYYAKGHGPWMLSRFVKPGSNCPPAIRKESIQIGDIFMICTDGVHEVFDLATMERIIAENSTDPVDAAQALAATAGLRSRDDITVVVVRCHS